MHISKLFIDREVEDFTLVESIKSGLKAPWEIIEEISDLYAYINNSKDPVKTGKEILYLTKNKGAFIKKCPGTKYYTCCDYYILHIGTFCTMDCSYCILQSYFHPPLLQYFVNHDDMLYQVRAMLKEKKIRRIGTGEFTDSMIWELITDLSPVLIREFARQSFCVLELKTKTTAIDKLKNLDHNKKTIMAWSVNTPFVIKTNERKTAPLSKRLEAAAKCQSWGYPLAFHFDPMVIYKGCEDDYKKTVEEIFRHVSCENIVWISLGTFRFMPPLKSLIKERFPASKIIYGEFIRGMDDKMRYFKPLRIELYKKMVSWIRDLAPDVLVYFCMEDDKSWEKSFGFLPEEHGGLPYMLDKSAISHCNLES